MSRNYKFHNKSGLYFLSFATVYWIDVFIREAYFSTIVESLAYCRQEKSMALYAYCIMPSHIHLIFRSSKDDPSGLLRDFKKYTSKKIMEAIEGNTQESRKEWLLWMFERAAKSNATVSKRQFWQQHNKPIELWSASVIKQKLDYIHSNPVKSGFVVNPEDWKYSSAVNFNDEVGVLELDDLGFMGENQSL